ncbi:MAG: DUF4139 domain-containing protein [Spirochaetales bacterium]
MKHVHRTVLFALFLLFPQTAVPTFVAAQPAKPESSPSPAGIPPLRRVVLYTNGTAYFEREAMVSGSGILDLSFPVKDIDDLLKSLVVRDPEQGNTSIVTYGTRDPIDRVMKSFSIDLSDNPDLPTLLLRARGESVEIQAGEQIVGTLFGIETHTSPEYPPADAAVFVNILTSQGLRSVPYRQISSFRFLNPDLNKEIYRALQYLAENRNRDRKRVSLSVSGTGTRAVKIGYVLENPVWKATFRLILRDGQKPLLQGWGIVENSTDEDWEDVQLDLVSGQPISFAMNLYEPLFNPRPKIPYTVERQLPPPVYPSGVSPAPSVPSAKRSRTHLATEEQAEKSLAFAFQDEADAPPEPESMAEASSSGDYIRYTIKAPVTLPRRQAALLPILNTPIEGEAISIYNEGVNRNHPLRGVWLRNTTGLALMGGPVTVFEAGQYAGDARIDTVSAGDRRILSYAVDLDTEVLLLDKSFPETISRIRIVKGNLLVSRIQRKERSYMLVNRGEAPRSVLIEHPVSAGFKLEEPSTYEERTESFYRFRVAVPPRAGSGVGFRVVEERPLETTVSLSTLQEDRILFYINQRSLDGKVRAALTRVMDLRNGLSEASRTRESLESRIDQISQDQQRIRSNMEVLDRTSPLYQRYLKILGEQEDTLAELQQNLIEARKVEDLRRKALEEYLSNLEVE